MKELNIKIDFDSIKEYMPEEELREIVKNAIESQINQYYNHDINELIKSYLFRTLEKHTDNIFMNTPYIETKVREQIDKCIEDLHTYEVFRNEHRGYFGLERASVAQGVLEEYCATDEFRQKLKTKIDSVVSEKFEQMEPNDFIYMLSDGMADVIKNTLLKKDKGDDND